MSILNLIIFGLVGFWFYYSVKHEGVFWIPRTATALGSFFIFIWMCFKIASQVKPAWFAFFVMMSSAGVLMTVVTKFVLWCDKKVEERVGKDPYNKKDKLTPQQERIQAMRDEAMRDELITKNNLDPDE